MNKINNELTSVRTSIETLQKLLKDNPDLPDEKVKDIEGKIHELSEYRDSLLNSFDWDIV